MCFSAPASFVTAGITGTIGIVALSRVSEPRELPLAATPLLFAFQQCIEGLLWLSLPQAPDGYLSAVLTILDLFFAEAFWPLYAPIAVWLIEPNEYVGISWSSAWAWGRASALICSGWILGHAGGRVCIAHRAEDRLRHRFGGGLPRADPCWPSLARIFSRSPPFTSMSMTT
jgi:hypothetical protein